MEARLARVESDVAHLVTDMADVKADVRSLRDKTDDGFGKLNGRIDGLNDKIDRNAKSLNDRIDGSVGKLNDKIDGLHDKLDARLQTLQDSLAHTRVSLSESISAAKIWALVLYAALAAGMFGTMARGFGWI